MSTESLLAQLESESFLERLVAREELSKRNDPASLPRLLRLLKAELPGVRAEAVEIVGHFKDPTLFEAVATVLKEDAAWVVRVGAVNALAAMRDPRAALLLMTTLARDDWPYVRAQAGLALSVYPGCEAARALVTALGDTGSFVSDHAAMALRDMTSGNDRAAWQGWVETTCPAGSQGETGKPPALPTPATEDIDREEQYPGYASWASFKPGSWVARRTENSTSMADMKETLKSVTSTEAVIEVQIAHDGNDPGAAKIEAIPAKRKASPGGESNWTEGEEVLTLNGQKIRCSTLQWAGETYWYSDAIPGGLVRYEWKNDMGRVVMRIFVTDWEALR